MSVLLFTAHKLSRCDTTCPGCMICEGGLALCVTCRGGEASLPSQCPMRRMTCEEEMAVQAGDLDYKDGAWHTLTREATRC